MTDDPLRDLLRANGLDLDQLSDPAFRESLSLDEAALVLGKLIDVRLSGITPPSEEASEEGDSA